MNNSRSEITAVTARAKRQFPDHNVGCVFHVCLPIYEVRLKTTVLAEDELSTPARFVLQLTNLGVTRTEEIGRLLGISDNYVISAAGELLGNNLVDQWADLNLGITDRGKKVLSDGGKTLRPRNRHIKVPYDPLTKKIIDLDIDSLLERTYVRKNGLFIPPTGPRKPQLSRIHIDEVRNYDRLFGKRRDKTELIEISDVKDARIKYRYDVILVRLGAPNTDKPLFAAYRSQQYLEEESGALQRLADRGAGLVPEDLLTEPSMLRSQPATLSQKESTLFEEIGSLDQNIGEAEKAVAEAKTTQGTTQNAQERTELEARIKQLEADKSKLEDKLNERENELNTRTQGKVYRLKTEDHRHQLLYAITTSSSELTIVSAWISPVAFDDELCQKLADAISRGTRVRIAWGLGTHKPGYEADRKRGMGTDALKALERLIAKNAKENLENLTVKRTETHEKFIICDNLFCVWGSFNWLSYRGEIDRGYRRETSLYSERKEDIDCLKGVAEEIFQGY